MDNDFLEFQTISIDFDVFKALTARLESPSDSYNGVLRRVFSLPRVAQTGVATAGSPPVGTPFATTRSPNGSGRSWIVGGATFPDGMELRAKYKGRMYSARVRDGALVYDGVPYDSPSPAAIAVTGNSVNGWNFWECRKPGTNAWAVISSYRSKQQ